MTPEMIAAAFLRGETVADSKAFGSGHINRTCLITTDSGNRYVLQNINTYVFPEPDQVMANVVAVTNHLRGKGQTALEFWSDQDGNFCHREPDGSCWRLYRFVDGLALDAPRSIHDLYQAGLAFGCFQQHLEDFPAETLFESIPNFHNTPDRYRKFKAAVDADVLGRAAAVQAEIHQFLAWEEMAGKLCAMLQQGQLPLRVTHNDTKLNNVLLSKDTGKALCVLDLDTVMPGLSAWDFGDGIRFGAAVSGEDANTNALDLQRFRTFAEGFLEGAPNLTKAEIDALPLGAFTMTLEVGLRFLTDYLEGDRYFKTDYPDHNLHRARNQMALATDIEKKLPQLEQLIQNL